MKGTQRVLTKRYLLSFYSSGRGEGNSLKILLRKGITTDAKKLNWKRYKKSIFALESGP